MENECFMTSSFFPIPNVARGGLNENLRTTAEHELQVPASLETAL